MIACSIASHFGLNPGCCLDWAWNKRNLPEGLRDVAKNRRLTWKKTWYRQLFAPIHAKRLSLRPWLVVSIILSISPCLKIGWSQPKYDKTMKKWWMAGIIPPASFIFNQKCCFVSLLFGLTCVNLFGDCSSLKIIVIWWVWICFATHNLPGMMIPQHIHIYIYKHVYMYMYMHTCIHACMHAYIRTYSFISPLISSWTRQNLLTLFVTLPLFSELIMLLYCVVRYFLLYTYHIRAYIVIHIHITFPTHVSYLWFIYQVHVQSCLTPIGWWYIHLCSLYVISPPILGWYPHWSSGWTLPSGSGINLSKKTTPHNPFRLHILINYQYPFHVLSSIKKYIPYTINIH